MISFEINLSCDDPSCDALLSTDILKELNVVEVLAYAEAHDWAVTSQGVFCPKHKGEDHD